MCLYVVRQAALTILKELAAYPHLANGDYADVNREIKKIINKDSNIQVSSEVAAATRAAYSCAAHHYGPWQTTLYAVCSLRI